MMTNKKIIIFFFTFIYILIGTYLSLTNGITSDESFEQLNWIENLNGVQAARDVEVASVRLSLGF